MNTMCVFQAIEKKSKSNKNIFADNAILQKHFIFKIMRTQVDRKINLKHVIYYLICMHVSLDVVQLYELNV